jgi:hypothetical protein
MRNVLQGLLVGLAALNPAFAAWTLPASVQSAASQLPAITRSPNSNSVGGAGSRSVLECEGVRVPLVVVLNVVFDATALRLWVSYAGDGKEAYQRPYVITDLAALDGDGDGVADLPDGSVDADGDGHPDFWTLDLKPSYP